MPVAPEEILNKLTAAIQEAKDTTRELHEARKRYIEAVRHQEADVRNLVEQRVDRAVGDIRVKARADMEEALEAEISSFVADLRMKLGMD